MADLEAAQRHLNEALRRLESALARRLSRPGGGEAGAELGSVIGERDTLARDVAVLRHECDRLSVALRDAEEEKRQIREIGETVARRLDGSISELDRLLED